MREEIAKPFARYGCEKMIYDVRMGPVALCYNDIIYIAYQANPNGPEAHPHIITYDLQGQRWSKPIQMGKVARYDHHFAPVLWFDHEAHIHVLFHCHSAQHGAIHVVSTHPESVEEWAEAPEIAPSISYPHTVRIYDDKLLLFYRTFGHMGYWTYQISDDGGYSWTPANIPIIDFDQEPKLDSDTWAGTYHSVCAGKDGRSLHIAFVYWDERKRLNPLYKRKFGSINRRHLYYLRLDIPSGQLYTIEGDRIETPVTRERAEKCKIWDTGYRLANMPSILIDDNDEPCFVMPVSEEAPWNCKFYFIRRKRGEWIRQPIVGTNNTWAGAYLTKAGEAALTAYLVVGDVDGEGLSYGGGDVEEWVSTDGGASWKLSRKVVPEPGLLYNNPRPIEYTNGGVIDGFLLFYGWEGPGSIQPIGGSGNSKLRGNAYLWNDGKWL